MSELLIGACLPNYEDVTDTDFARLKAMRADICGMLWTNGTRHRRAIYDRLERELDRPVYSVRVGPSGKTTPRQWARDAEDALREVPPLAYSEGRVRVRCLNEVNLPSEGGWSPEDYATFLADCGDLFRDDVPLVASPISLGDPTWRDWWERFVAACGGLIPADRISVNCYAHLVPEAASFVRHGRPVDVTEINTLAFSGRDRGRWTIDRCRELAGAGIESAQVFIVGGHSFGQWDERYILADDEADEIGKRGAIEVSQATQTKPNEGAPMPQNPTRQEAEAYAREQATEHGYPADLFVRQIDQESGFRQYADDGSILTSPAGAKGIGQFMPQFWPESVWSDWRSGLRTAAEWMGQLFAQYGNVVLPLVHYNGGQGAVEAYRSGHPIAESVAYVDAIIGDACVAQFGGALSAFPAEVVASACGPIAIAGQMVGLGIPGTVEGVLQIARDYGWTPAGGMNGTDNFTRLAGACWVSESSIAAEDVAPMLWQGRFVVISTPRHYYLAQRPSRSDADLYVGNTGRARIGGSEWMSLARIAELDGVINGLFVGERSHAAEQPAPPAPVVDELTDALNNIEDLTLTPGPHSEDRRVSAQRAINTIKKHLEAA